MDRVGAAVTSGGTIGAGVATLLQWIPVTCGAVASLCGACLSVVLIVHHVKKGRLEREKLRIEIDRLRREG